MLQRACQSLPAGPSLATNKTVNRLFITQFTPFYNNVSRIIWPNLCIQNTLSPHFCPTNFVRNHTYSMLSGLNILLKNYFVFTKVVNSYLMLLGCKSVWGFLCKNGHHYQFIASIIRLVTTVQVIYCTLRIQSRIVCRIVIQIWIRIWQLVCTANVTENKNT